jgi:spore maturation protein B
MNEALITQLANGMLLAIIATILLAGCYRRVRVYDSFLSGAKQGIDVIVNLIPVFIAMVVAVGMLRASGAIERISQWLQPVLSAVGFPVEILPLALVRPFSAAASNGVLIDVLQQHGGDSLIAQIAATIMGSTETTFYVVAVYFSAVNIQRIRHAAWAGLIADGVGIVASIIVCRLLLS